MVSLKFKKFKERFKKRDGWKIHKIFSSKKFFLGFLKNCFVLKL